MSCTPATLTGVLDRHARERGTAVALHYGARAVTWASLRDQSLRIARGLHELGVREGDRVALWLPNTPAWLACLFACARLGAIALATNTRFRSAEMDDILCRSGARVLVYWPAYRGIDFDAIVEDLPAGAAESLGAVVAYSEEGDPPHRGRLHGVPVHPWAALDARPPWDRDVASPAAGCLMFTTSGTTKAPKFVLHTQASIVAHMYDVAEGFGYAEPGSVGLGALPFCGTYGFSTALSPLAVAAPLVVAASFRPREILDAMRRHGVTGTNLTGDMIAQLLAAADDSRPFARVRFCGCGTGSAEQIGPAAARGLRVAGLYGSSEVQALFSHQNEIDAPLSDRAAGGGRPVSPRAGVRVRDVESGRLLSHGESGMLEITGPSLFNRYFGNEEATREAFTEDGWFRTGDLGHTVADGRFVYQARMGDALRLSGFLVSPAQIESVLAEHPAIAECQVIGLEQATGMRPYAFVTVRPGLRFDEAEVLALARERMARYKVPARVFAVEAFPVTESANATKVQKAKLRDMAIALVAGAPDRT